MISTFLALLLCCVVMLAWVRTFDLVAESVEYKPTRRQRKQWDRERLVLPRVRVNRRRS